MLVDRWVTAPRSQWTTNLGEPEKEGWVQSRHIDMQTYQLESYEDLQRGTSSRTEGEMQEPEQPLATARRQQEESHLCTPCAQL